MEKQSFKVVQPLFRSAESNQLAMKVFLKRNVSFTAFCINYSISQCLLLVPSKHKLLNVAQN